MADLLKTFEPEIEVFTLVPSDGGRFEVTVNNRLLYSKLQTHRHAEPGEISELIRKYLMEGNR
jgi:selenoprotein W-related protein